MVNDWTKQCNTGMLFLFVCREILDHQAHKEQEEQG